MRRQRATLHELAGVEVSVSQVERAAEALGSEIATDERSCVMGDVAPTMYLGMDGTGVPMRKSEVAGRVGKQSDGSAKTREAKAVTMWIESAAALNISPERSQFAERVLREATRRGFTQAARGVVLGDGSAWIWNTAAELFPQAIQILDRFHAKEHLSKVGKIIYRDSKQGKKWIQRRYELDEGRLKSLLKALDRQAIKYQEALECADYIRNNRHRMHYPEFSPTRFMHLHRRRGGRLQSTDRRQAQAGWHALDRKRRKRHHCPALLQGQQSL